MQKSLKWFVIIVVSLVMLLLVVMRVFYAYSQRSLQDTHLKRSLTRYHENVTLGLFEQEDISLHYVRIGDPTKPILFLIHGAPGSINDWEGVFAINALYKHFQIIAIDRLGYGHSNKYGVQIDLAKQAQSITLLLKHLGLEQFPLYLLGHSYGGPIVARLLMTDTNQHIAGAVIAAGAVDPDHETFFMINDFIPYPPLSWILPPMLKTANAEKLSHPTQLKKYLTDRKNITAPVIVVHGTADSLVPLANAHYIKAKLGSGVSMIYLTGEDHPLQYNNPQSLVDAVLQLLSQ